MDNTLGQAFAQWCDRPADERFPSLESLHEAVTQHRADSRVANVKLSALEAEVDAETNAPVVQGPTGALARFTHFSFGQFARRLSAPAAYLRKLPASIVASALNHALKGAEREDGDDAALLLSRPANAQDEMRTLRCAVTPKYTRIWNSDITSRLLRLVEQRPEWQPAPAAFDGSRGLYASDHDVFAFMVNNDRRIFETLPGGGLGRGFFVSNSEVGDASFRVTTFLYEYVCGNHRVWGASGVREIRIPHIGNADARAFGELGIELVKYADASAGEDETRILRARAHVFGTTKDEVLDAVFGLRVSGLSRATIAASYARAAEQEDRYGNPASAWGLTGGMTEIARDLPHADARVALERQAGKVLEVAF